MTMSNKELKQKLFDAAEQFAQRWRYEKVNKLRNGVEDHLYSESEPKNPDFWQSHLSFLEVNADEKGEYVMLCVDISDNRTGGLLKKGSAWSPMTASLVIYKDGTHEINL
jgi:hypothetical protein